MQDLRITLAQVNQFWEDKQRNLDHFSAMLENIGQTDLILLPEMFHTGFSMNAEALAEEQEQSEALAWLRKTAAAKNAAIYTSFIAAENGRFFNRGVFAFPDGNLTFYDKRKCFGMAGETEVYTPGSRSVVPEYKGWKINLQICYDLRFPEISRNSTDENGEAAYDVLLYVANWPQRRIAHWNALLPARAIENQCYVAAVNRVGTDANGLKYNGSSGIWSAMGEKLAGAGDHSEEMTTFVLSAAELRQVRTNLPFLKDRS